MKKLMVMATVAMLGIAASASTMVWGNPGAALGAGYSALMTGSATAYLIYGTPAASFDNAAYLQAHDTYTIADVLGVLGGTNTGLTTTVGEDGLFSSDNQTWSGSVGSNKKFYTVIIDADGQNMAYTTVTSKSSISAQDTSKATLSWVGSTDFSSVYTAAAAPEPTSGLLLLLGVAGLALKRKRA